MVFVWRNECIMVFVCRHTVEAQSVVISYNMLPGDCHFQALGGLLGNSTLSLQFLAIICCIFFKLFYMCK